MQIAVLIILGIVRLHLTCLLACCSLTCFLACSLENTKTFAITFCNVEVRTLKCNYHLGITGSNLAINLQLEALRACDPPADNPIRQSQPTTNYAVARPIAQKKSISATTRLGVPSCAENSRSVRGRGCELTQTKSSHTHLTN